MATGCYPDGVKTDELIDRARSVLAPRPEVLEAYLFGSHTRGEAQPHSDVDVAVFVSAIPEAPFGYEAELATELSRALATDRVDVVVLNRAGPLLYHRVLRDGVRVLARDLRATTGREGQALSRYCDYAVQLAKLDPVVRARIERGELGQ